MSKKTKAEEGKTAAVHYVGTYEDGTQFDNSRERQDPLIFELGANQIISGFEEAVLEMTVGEVKEIKLTPEQAYGEVNEEAFHTVPQDSFGDDASFRVGQPVFATTDSGEELQATVHSLQDDTVTLNFNHPMAGKTLNFELELLSVE